MTNILVLGATGKVGTPLVDVLSKKNVSFRAGARNPDEAKKKINVPKAEWVPFEYEKISTYAHAFDGITDLFLLTPVTPHMVELTGTVVDFAKRAGVKRIVKLSAIGTGPDATFSFGRWHFEAEKIVEGSGLQFVFLRPNGFMQNYLGVYAMTMKKQNAFFTPLGDAKVSYIDARDIARVAAVALTGVVMNGKKLDLTGPESLTNTQVADILTKVTGRKINHVPVSFERAKEGMRAAKMPDWLANTLTQLYQSYANGEAAAVSKGVEEATRTPGNTFEKFVTEFKTFF